MTSEEVIQRLQSLLKETPKSISVSTLSELLLSAAEEIWDSRKGVSMRGVDGAPDWHGYESTLWKLSEQIRAFLKSRRDLRGINPLSEAIRLICANPKFGKGRQNFVLLIGEFGGASYCAQLSILIDDSEVSGHAVKALSKAMCFGYVEQVQRLVQTTRVGWIKTAAKKYLEHSGGSPS